MSSSPRTRLNNSPTSWNSVADWYDEHLQQAGTYQHDLILPNLLRLLPLQNSHTLDLACGQGFFSHHFGLAGATVVGVDVSPELILRAQKNAPQGIFHVAPAHKLSFLKERSFDLISIILALQNIEEVGAVFQECSRLLKPGGSVALVLTHPCFRVPKQSSWEWDEKEKIQYRRIDSYLSESKHKIDMHPGLKNNPVTITFHRPLQYYFKLLSKHGLFVTRLEEWNSHKNTPAGPRAEAENKARKEIPLFLFLSAKKEHSAQ